MTDLPELRRAAQVLGIETPPKAVELRSWVSRAITPTTTAADALADAIRAGASEATRRRLLQAAQAEAASTLRDTRPLVAACDRYEFDALLDAIGDPVEAARAEWGAAADVVVGASVGAAELVLASRPHERPHDAVALMSDAQRVATLGEVQRANDTLDGLFAAVTGVLAATGTKAQRQGWRDGRLFVEIDPTFDADARRVIEHRVKNAVSQGRCSGRWSMLFAIEGVTPRLGTLAEVTA